MDLYAQLVNFYSINKKKTRTITKYFFKKKEE